MYTYKRTAYIIIIYILCIRSHYIASLRAIDSILPDALYTSRGEFRPRPAGIIIKLMMTEHTSDGGGGGNVSICSQTAAAGLVL